MIRSRRKTVRQSFLPLAVGFGLLSAGCGGGDKNDGQIASSPEASNAAQAVAKNYSEQMAKKYGNQMKKKH